MSYVDTFEPEPESDELVQAVGHLLPWAIVGSFCVWAGWAWLVDGVNALSLMLAVVFGLFQIATNILAVWVRRLAQRGAWLTTFFAFAAMIGTGLLTHASLDHAYEVTRAKGYMTADPVLMSWLLLVVPYLEPLMFWINRLLSEPRKPAKPKQVQVGLLTALWIGLFGTGPALATEPASNVLPLDSPPAPVSRQISRQQSRSIEPARAQAKLLAKTGVKAAEIHRSTGVPLSTCKRYATDARLAA